MTSTSLPRAGSRERTGVAPLLNNNFALLQMVLFWAGAILLPLGLVVIVLGWYGAANTPYEYDQMSYLVSGGMLGLGMTFVGGFLYFGAWLARIANDNREASKRLGDTLLVLAEVTSRAAAAAEAAQSADTLGADLGATPVTVGEGSTMHRRDCSLIAHRDDLVPASASNTALTVCRVCRPTPL
ncbi:hypothetical protein [Nocardioides alcanivorans]|uniref:hypothetical protein n=1 Tax=Nocardioides alcanivorans TaxID=2897352 RepID=UPI001F42E305|nr:hypothetical protein [Nocardioides alcanivorans]